MPAHQISEGKMPTTPRTFVLVHPLENIDHVPTYGTDLDALLKQKGISPQWIDHAPEDLAAATAAMLHIDITHAAHPHIQEMPELADGEIAVSSIRGSLETQSDHIVVASPEVIAAMMGGFNARPWERGFLPGSIIIAKLAIALIEVDGEEVPVASLQSYETLSPREMSQATRTAA